ncbi:MAG TPA: ester cyclase [Chitinophagales bacterium]|nr:ester cyclase [Chitinophagales bacterium]
MKNAIQILCVVITLSACTLKAGSPAESFNSTASKNKALALAFYEKVVNAHNVAMIDSFMAENYIEHEYDTHFAGNKKGVKKAFQHYFEAIPDMHTKVNFIMAEGDLVTVNITTSGTNTGPIYGRPATNRKFEINGADIIRFKNGKAVEHWGYQEEGKMLNQLGLLKGLMKEEKNQAANTK